MKTRWTVSGFCSKLCIRCAVYQKLFFSYTPILIKAQSILIIKARRWLLQCLKSSTLGGISAIPICLQTPALEHVGDEH